MSSDVELHVGVHGNSKTFATLALAVKIKCKGIEDFLGRHCKRNKVKARTRAEGQTRVSPPDG